MKCSALFSFIVIALFTVLGAAPASAEKLSQKISVSELKSRCGSIGGEWSEEPALGMGTCTNKNCDGKGGDCQVTCSDRVCTGTTPTTLTGPQTLLSILQDGDRVFREPDQTPTGSLAGGGDGGVAPGGGGDPEPPPVLEFY
jgi:hypothetical protein